MRKRWLFVFSAMLLCLAAPAGAQDDYSKNGAFIALGSGVAIDVEDALGNDVTWAASGRLGFRYGYVSAEIQLEGYGDIKGPAIPFNFRLYPLKGGRIQPFLTGGIGAWNAKLGSSYDWGGQVRGGGGLDLYLVPQWALGATAEYLHGTGQLQGLDLVTVRFDVIYRF